MLISRNKSSKLCRMQTFSNLTVQRILLKHSTHTHTHSGTASPDRGE